jgi:hypothetical protein
MQADDLQLHRLAVWELDGLLPLKTDLADLVVELVKGVFRLPDGVLQR